MEIILSGKLYKGREAFEAGLVHSVVASDQLLKEAERVLEPILRNPQHALSQAKKAVRASQNTTLAKGQEIESLVFSRCFSHGYFLELMRKQLKEGTLKTTVKLPKWVLEERKKKP
jgi:enoyl-CoA hydratase/carnithine racemase